MIKEARDLKPGEWFERGNVEYQVSRVKAHVENAHEPPFVDPTDELIVEEVAGAIDVIAYGPEDDRQTFTYKADEEIEVW